ncbi:hypothetical protein Dda_6539 [Drechslerella dactyloides]|uniref:Uncharacterized protein n=1 Tax=Drechslerella dactyloides TaxID=74499 RepID=A0AAD6IUB9_DREDA|nr:hypothetical protein Dda_6539 [Drechslerella dactyloides]
MHFAYYKLVTSTNPLTQRYYTLYTSAILLLQLYLLLAITYHLRLTLPSPSHSHSSHDDDGDENGLDASFFFHVFLGWATSVMNVGRLIGHAGAESWDSYIRREFRVGRFDGVVAVAWCVPYHYHYHHYYHLPSTIYYLLYRTLPYVMVPFAVFGDYAYVGLTYLIPLPMILGYALARWLHYKTVEAYRAGGGYDKLDDAEADVGVDDMGEAPPPEYEAVQREAPPTPCN